VTESLEQGSAFLRDSRQVRQTNRQQLKIVFFAILKETKNRESKVMLFFQCEKLAKTRDHSSFTKTKHDSFVVLETDVGTQSESILGKNLEMTSQPQQRVSRGRNGETDRVGETLNDMLQSSSRPNDFKE
jgi:hypothetical protein